MVVIISGATSGIGKALAERYRADGYTVCNLSRSCETEGDNYKCDVTDEEKVTATVDEIAAKYGRIDVVINNAGSGISGATELIPTKEIKKAMDVSYYGALYLTRACLKYMKRGGRIIFMSSISGITAIPFRSVYCSAKAAELMLGEALRMELSQAGIKVISFCPGEIKTNFSRNKYAGVESNARYGKRVENALKKVSDRESHRMPLDKISAKIYKKCVKGRKAVYVIGGIYKILYLGYKILPTTTYLKLTDRLLGGREKKSDISGESAGGNVGNNSGAKGE